MNMASKLQPSKPTLPPVILIQWSPRKCAVPTLRKIAHMFDVGMPPKVAQRCWIAWLCWGEFRRLRWQQYRPQWMRSKFGNELPSQ
jgi:hypothetical protein